MTESACTSTHTAGTLPSLRRRVPEKPYDLLQARNRIAASVTQNKARLYSGFSVSPNFGGSVKAYAVGCELRCGFCWSPTRSAGEVARLQRHSSGIAQNVEQELLPLFNSNSEALHQMLDISRSVDEVVSGYFTPREVIDRMVAVYENRTVSGIGSFELCTEGEIPDQLRYFTLSGGEPTLCQSHLIAVIEEFANRHLPLKFLLQSHGFQLGHDRGFLEQLVRFRSVLEVRISFKAGTPEALSIRTGISQTSFELPFRAVENLIDLGIDFHVAAMTDPAVMPTEERDRLLTKLASICRDRGKRLCRIAGLGDVERSALKSQGEIESVVWLDEETYVDVFPNVLATFNI